MPIKEVLSKQLIEKLHANIDKRACIGLDGFVDRIIHVVDKRLSTTQYTRVQTLKEYGTKIVEASGMSLNFEMIPINKKYGGNGPIMAGALALLGVETDCIGAFGKGAIDEVFMPLNEKVGLYSFTDPATTDAIEFTDGKIISSILKTLNEADWELLVRYVGLQKIIELFDESDLIAINNWAMMPEMTDIWRHILSDVFPKLSKMSRIIFFDLADPTKRSDSDITEALNLVKRFSEFGQVCMSCNERESRKLASVMGLFSEGTKEMVCSEVANAIGIEMFVTHLLDGSLVSYNGKVEFAPGFFCASPALTTGGGDNFNAGLCYALMQGIEPQLSAFAGNSVSGFYVRNGRSPSMDELLDFLIQQQF